MNTNKDQIQQLTPEQQEALGLSVVQRHKIRQRLLEQRGHYRAISWLSALVMVALYLAPMLITNPKYFQIAIIIVGMSLWVLIQFHAGGINRRIDALIKLMEDDHDA